MTQRSARDKPLVLIVDDESTGRLLTRAALEQAGFAALDVENGKLALAAFEQEHPDMVLLDVDMPGMDGFTVCRTLRSRPDARHVPIVMVTGRDDMASIKEAYEAGATDFVPKPIHWGLLGHRVRYVLRAADALREVAAGEEKFRLIAENVGDFIAMLDTDGRRIYISPSYRNLFGDSDLTGTESFREIHPDDRETVRQMFRKTVDTGRGQPARFRFLAADGAVRFMESQGNVIRDESGKVSKVVVVSRDVTEHKTQQERIDRMKNYFSPHLAEAIVAGGGDDLLKPHRCEVTVVAIDLRGFTAFTDDAEPEEVMEMLNAYHAEMGKLILAHNGTLEHFAGDGMMIFFNDPVQMERPEEHAARMALAMHQAFAPLAQAWRKRGFELGLGIGIATGFATLGAIGFDGRWDYAVIGSVANLSARLCGEAKPGETLLERKTLARLDGIARVDDAGVLMLKGFAKATQCFCLLGLDGPASR